MSVPIWAYLSTLLSGTAMGQSANLSVIVAISGFDGFFNINVNQPNTANISAGPEVYAYRGTGQGASYATIAGPSASVIRSPNGKDNIPIRLESGNWVFRIISGGGSAGTWSFSIGTWDMVSAIA